MASGNVGKEIVLSTPAGNIAVWMRADGNVMVRTIAQAAGTNRDEAQEFIVNRVSLSFYLDYDRQADGSYIWARVTRNFPNGGHIGKRDSSKFNNDASYTTQDKTREIVENALMANRETLDALARALNLEYLEAVGNEAYAAIDIAHAAYLAAIKNSQEADENYRLAMIANGTPIA